MVDKTLLKFLEFLIADDKIKIYRKTFDSNDNFIIEYFKSIKDNTLEVDSVNLTKMMQSLNSEKKERRYDGRNKVFV